MRYIRRDEQPETLKARKRANPDFYTLCIDSSEFGWRQFRRKARKVWRGYREFWYRVEKISFFMRTRWGTKRICARFYMTLGTDSAPTQ